MQQEVIDKLAMIAEATGKAFAHVPGLVNQLYLLESEKEVRFTHYADPLGAQEIAQDIRNAMLPYGYLAHAPSRKKLAENFFEYIVRYDG